MAEYNYIGDGSPDGTLVGRTSTEKLGFYGTAPIARPTLTGSKSSNAVVSTIVAALGNLGIVTDSSSA